MFYFLHLHKCAGTTFVDLAKTSGVRLFKPNGNGNPLNPLTGRRFAFWEWDEREQRYFLSSRQYGLVANERELGRDHEFYEGVTYVVILRDPVERMLSHFEWRYRDTLDHDRSPKERARAFVDYVQSHKSVWWAENYFVHALTFSSGKSGQAQRGDAELFELAKKRLQNFEHIFFVDRFDSDVTAMQAYGWAAPERRLKSIGPEGTARSSVSAALEEFPDMHKKILARNEDDLELYAFARKLAAKRSPKDVPARKFTISRHERPESDNFEFNLFCAYEAHVGGKAEECRELLDLARSCGIPDEIEDIDAASYIATAVARFNAPKASPVRPARKAFKDGKVAAKSAERQAKLERRAAKQERKKLHQKDKVAKKDKSAKKDKAAKKARRAAG
jgi:hypothetical protein